MNGHTLFHDAVLALLLLAPLLYVGLSRALQRRHARKHAFPRLIATLDLCDPGVGTITIPPAQSPVLIAGPGPGTWKAGSGNTRATGGEVRLNISRTELTFGPEEAEQIALALATSAREARAQYDIATRDALIARLHRAVQSRDEQLADLDRELAARPAPASTPSDHAEASR